MADDIVVQPKLVTVSQAAKQLSCSRATIYRMFGSELQPVRLRSVPGAALRIKTSDLDRLLGEPNEDGDEPR
jgi:excisionase family DNA binding protein